MESFRSKNQFSLFLKLLKYIRPYWDKYLLVVILLIIQGTIHALPVLLLSKLPMFVDQGTAGEYIRFCFFLLLPVLIFRWVIFDSILFIMIWYVGLKMAFKLRLDLYRHMERMSLAFFQSRPVGEHIYRANFDIDSLIPLLNSTQNGIPALISNIYQTILMAWLVSVAGSDILFYLTLILIPIYIIVHFLYRRVQQLDYQKRARAQEVESVLRQGIAGIRVIKAFNRIRYTIRRYYSAMVKYYKTGQAAYLLQFTTDQFRVSPIHVIWPLSLPFFAYLGLKGAIPIITWGSIIYFSRAMLYFLDGSYRCILNFRLYLVPTQRLFETLEIEPEISHPPDARRISHLSGEIQFDNVTFSYEKDHPVLEDISFVSKPGQKVAIVGPSGAGKSTLAMLLLRFYKPDSGDIIIDNHSVDSLNMNSIINQTGIILQDTFLFGGTIEDNIRYAKFDATEQEIIDAAKAADIHTDIINMPQGYQTDVAEGSSLSGGQKQRIAIARALLKKPKLLILDEATASLDISTERAFMKTLNTHFAAITTFIITHRINSIIDADDIIVLQQGRIVEQGTHRQLMQNGGFYKQLYEQQAG